jgi:hypothetical protein
MPSSIRNDDSDLSFSARVDYFDRDVAVDKARDSYLGWISEERLRLISIRYRTRSRSMFL